jgi:antitoxin (DNA-binding transcriptional repressor) of toxin-antitoxin stability system
MPTQFIGIKEFRNNLATIARDAQKGMRYIVLRKNTPVWEVTAISPKDRILEKLVRSKMKKHTLIRKDQ